MFWILGIVAVFLKYRLCRDRLASAQESPRSRRRLQSLAKSMFRKYKSSQQDSSTIPLPVESWYPGPSTSSSSPSSSSHGAKTSRSNGDSSSPSSSSHGAKTSRSNGDSSSPSPSSSHTPSHNSIMDGVNQISAVLGKHKNMDLQKLLLDEGEYSKFLHSLEPVSQLDTIQADLKKNNADLARENLEKAAQIAQLQNQCIVIRTVELAMARERFVSAQTRERQLSSQSSAVLHLERLEETIKQVDDESEDLHRRFLAGEMDLMQFGHNYRKLRNLYHRRTLVKLAAGDSGISTHIC